MLEPYEAHMHANFQVSSFITFDQTAPKALECYAYL